MVLSDSALSIQFLRYAFVGLASNAMLFLGYILLTAFGIGHKLAMTLLYAAGVLLTFVFNRRWSFNHDGSAHAALIRYIAAYIFGYVLNLALLVVMVDRWGLPHQWVQAGAILLVALIMFLLHRYWVFPRERAEETTSEAA